MVDEERDRALHPGLRCHPPPVDSAEQMQMQFLDPNQEQPQLHVWFGLFYRFIQVKLHLTSQVIYE